MERGNRRGGVALAAGAVEAAHVLPLPRRQLGGELGEVGHAAVAGEATGDRQREHRAQFVALAPGVAVVGHAAEELEQAAQLLPVRLGAGGCLQGGVVRRLTQLVPGMGLQFVHENLLGPAVAAPGRRRCRLARVAAGAAQRAPVGGPVAGAGKALRVDERFGEQDGEAVRRPHVARQPPQAQAEHPRR